MAPPPPPPNWANMDFTITEFSDKIDCEGKIRDGTATNRKDWHIQFSTGDIGADNRWKGKFWKPGGTTTIDFTWDQNKGELKTWPALFGGEQTFKVDRSRPQPPNGKVWLLEIVNEKTLSDGCIETIRIVMEAPV